MEKTTMKKSLFNAGKKGAAVLALSTALSGGCHDKSDMPFIDYSGISQNISDYAASYAKGEKHQQLWKTADSVAHLKGLAAKSCPDQNRLLADSYSNALIERVARFVETNYPDKEIKREVRVSMSSWTHECKPTVTGHSVHVTSIRQK